MAFGAAAAGAVDDDLANMSLAELLDVEVSVASKDSEKLSEAPSSVTVFSAVEIENMGVTRLQDLLNFVPGFQAWRDVEQGTAHRIGARGRATAISESVLVLLDGKRLNDLYSGGVSILNRAIPLAQVQQIEIIRGPGSALYGSNAFTGVINMVTKRGANDVSLAFGSMEHASLSGNFHGTFGAIEADAFVHLFSEDGDDFDQVADIFGRGGATQDPISGFDFQTNLSYKGYVFSARQMTRRLEDFLVFGALADNLNREKTNQRNFLLEKAFDLGRDMSLNVSAGYEQNLWETQALLIPRDLEIAPGFALSEHFVGGPRLRSHQAGLFLDFKAGLGEKHLLIAGASFERAALNEAANVMSHQPITLEYQGDQVAFDGDLSFNLEETRNIVGVYLQDKIRVNQRMSLTLGFRFDDYNDFGNSFNPRGALVYQLGKSSHVKLMHGTAFRAPNFLELYDRNNPVDFGNPNLDAETVSTTELALGHTGSSFSVTGTLFRSVINDIIQLGDPVEDPNNPLGAPSFFNGGEQESEGLELEGRAVLGRGWMLAGTWTSLFDTDDAAFPEDFGSLVVNWSDKTTNLNLNAMYRDRNAGLPDQNAYWVVNLAARVQVAENLSVRAAVANLNDERYRTYSAAFPDGVPNRGRTWTVGLRWVR